MRRTFLFGILLLAFLVLIINAYAFFSWNSIREYVQKDSILDSFCFAIIVFLDCLLGFHLWVWFRDHQIRRNLKEKEIECARTERLAAVGMLAAGVAHEYNNAHTQTLTALELLEKMTNRIESDAVKDVLELLRGGVERACCITKNLLVYSRRMQTEANYQKTVDLNKVVTSVLDVLQPSFTSEGVELVSHLSVSVPWSGNPGHINQIMTNLVINAKHALLGRLDEPRVTVRAYDCHGSFILSVEDNGCGMKDDELKKLFTPFFSTKGVYAKKNSPWVDVEGTGLGLAICDRIVKGYKGDITVESVHGEGSKFTVRLPKT